VAVDARWLRIMQVIVNVPVLPPFAPVGCAARLVSGLGGGGARLGSAAEPRRWAALAMTACVEHREPSGGFAQQQASSLAEAGFGREPHPSESAAAEARARR
jgi:hypothetical protein